MFQISTTHNIHDEILEKGYSVITADEIPLTDAMRECWEALRAEYPDLPPDNHLPDGGKYRFRRYDRFYFMPHSGELHLLPHEDYFQSTDINAVTGGIVRRFEPLLPETANNPFLQELIRFDFAQFPLQDVDMQYTPWQVDVHEIYVTADPQAQGHPTPEGIHRDGAEFVTVHLAWLNNAGGGLVTVYDDDKNPLEQFTLKNVLDSYLFNDAILWHGVTPIVSADGIHPAERGILTFDFHHMPELEKPE